ncbi:TPA: hypothetical protein HA265_00680 [Candidatus Woesearchaeota archaeon]|nr:hypothetical protein [Candidatus Woesearchaeota archaeon]
MGVGSEEELQAMWEHVDCDSYDEFMRQVEKGSLSLDNQLGVLIQFLRFSPDPALDQLGDCPLVVRQRAEIDAGIAAGTICLPYGIPYNAPGTLIQNLDEAGLEGFVRSWAGRGEEWNPPFAKAELPPKVEEYCRTHTLGEVIREFNIYAGINRICGNTHKGLFEDLLYPMDEWQLARALELAYNESTND